jgi:hypothetical protein
MLNITAANGIAISEPDGARLYVAGYPDGITGLTGCTFSTVPW